MSDLTIVIDTREQKPWDFSEWDVDTVSRKLDTGDYSVEGYEDVFAVERKSLEDLCLSFGTERERFEREVQRGGSELQEFQVIIEDNLHKILDYVGEPESPHVRSRMSPKSVMASISSWEERYDIDRFRWAGNRAQAAYECYNTLSGWMSEADF